ncbi:MAG: hypothetical protein KDA64_03930, partial [Rhodospirillaceae bacterium]|nr:hypothetical protein [Rhodospirillaceae bacterium]
FCEILSFDKPALLVPRVEPRLEQMIRASRAEEMGLVRMLPMPSGDPDVARMAEALAALPAAARPSDAMPPQFLDGLQAIDRLAGGLIGQAEPVRAVGT